MVFSFVPTYAPKAALSSTTSLLVTLANALVQTCKKFLCSDKSSFFCFFLACLSLVINAVLIEALLLCGVDDVLGICKIVGVIVVVSVYERRMERDC